MGRNRHCPLCHDTTCLKNCEARKACAHCGKRLSFLRPGGLCWRCYYTPEIWKQYVVASKYGKPGKTAPEKGAHERRRAGVLKPRQPGEAPYDCYDCRKWVCWRPLSRCPDCHRLHKAWLATLVTQAELAFTE